LLKQEDLKEMLMRAASPEEIIDIVKKDDKDF
jgi:hypothetical protein